MTRIDGARRHASRLPLIVGLAILALTVGVIPAAADSGGQSAVAGARAATARFHDLSAADAAGYSVQVADLAGITCIDSAAGAMGVHYLSPSLVPELFDATAAAAVDAATPELLVYAPGPNGQRLVALEYLTIKAVWDAQHASAPSLFGRTFDTTLAGNRYGLPDFYSLHAWIWDPNPTDIFAPYNPRVTCP
ncbi:MAG TPA: hypothetical protein VFW02_03795 [Candidatus Limnocylindrales bacterium]|nr:hypothetical protein [Candidatus Limnocylindrales bacterium]